MRRNFFCFFKRIFPFNNFKVCLELNLFLILLFFFCLFKPFNETLVNENNELNNGLQK